MCNHICFMKLLFVICSLSNANIKSSSSTNSYSPLGNAKTSKHKSTVRALPFALYFWYLYQNNILMDCLYYQTLQLYYNVSFQVVFATIYNCHLRQWYFCPTTVTSKGSRTFFIVTKPIIPLNLLLLTFTSVYSYQLGDASDVYLYTLLSQSPTPCHYYIKLHKWCHVMIQFYSFC